MEKLLVTTERPDANESNLRSGAYEALMSLLSNSPTDCYACVQQTTMVIMQRIQSALQMGSAQVYIFFNYKCFIKHGDVIDLLYLICMHFSSPVFAV